MEHEQLRKDLVAAGRLLMEMGILSGVEGNFSARIPGTDEMLISPAGIKAAQLEPQMLCRVRLDGTVLDGPHKPSSGVPMHAACYTARPEAGAVIHTHSTAATSFAIAGREIPDCFEALHDFAGGTIPVAPYGRLGSEGLGQNVLQTIGSAWAVLLQNHGVLAFGRDVQHAVKVAAFVEQAAQMVINATVLGRVLPLPAEAGSGH